MQSTAGKKRGRYSTAFAIITRSGNDVKLANIKERKDEKHLSLMTNHHFTLKDHGVMLMPIYMISANLTVGSDSVDKQTLTL